jgi:hypothetical protein
MKINKNGINKQTNLFKQDSLVRARKLKFNKLFIYMFLGAFPVLYGLYIFKANGLFKFLKLDEKYRQRVKQKEQEFNIDQEKNDKMIEDFEKKYEMNYSVIEYEKRIKYGNKEMNKKEDDKRKEGDNDVVVVDDKGDKLGIGEKNLDPTKLGTSIMFDKKLNK